MPRDFSSYALPVAGNPFEELAASARFEDAGKGRAGAVLVAVDPAGSVPLVRTTTRYRTPAQRFGAVHDRLAEQIREHAALPDAFNNALIERYTNAYATMGSHCDQALDLAEESFIAVYSCYRRPVAADPPRRLIVEPKEPGGEVFAVPLEHNGVVVFSIAANRRHRHKIVLDASARAVDNEWLGVTLRTSKTLVHFRDGQPWLADGQRLTLADDDQQREFYRLRRQENAEAGFTYPSLTYTISESDLKPA